MCIRDRVNDVTNNGTENIVAVENNDGGYDVITLKLGLTYEGTEISDDFTADTSLGVSTDSGDWTIEYLTDSDDENWTSVMDVEMGIGVDNNDTNQLLYRELEVRITLPFQNQTRTYENGHAVNMRFVSDGSINEASVRVNVPQQYNLSVGEIDESIGVGDGKESIVTTVIYNHGNGDDLVTITSSIAQDCIDDGWEVTPPNATIPVGPDKDRSQSFTIHAGTNTTETTCLVEFSVESSGDIDTLELSTNAIIATADLEILDRTIEPAPSDAIANTDGIFRIPIKNNGFLTAGNVLVTLEGAQAGTDYQMKQTTIVVPAGEIAFAEFAYSDLPPGNARLVVNVSVIDTPAVDDELTLEFPIKFSNVADEDGESSYLVWIIVALTLLVLYGGFKTARKGSSGRF